jgi:cytochrome c-type protein NapC
MFGTSIGAAIIFIFIGILLWSGFHWSLEVTSTDEFCVSCHEMEVNIFQDYKETTHYSNRSGVRASCADCHVPKPLHRKIIRKIQATSELYHLLVGTIDTPEKFEAHRHQMAQNVWKGMEQTNSRECRNCHDFSQMNPKKQKETAAKQHASAQSQGKTCIHCHKGIAHKLSDKFMEIEHEQYIAEEADCQQCHEDM